MPYPVEITGKPAHILRDREEEWVWWRVEVEGTGKLGGWEGWVRSRSGWRGACG